MGRARQQMNTTVATRRVDPFAATFGAVRGRASLNALLAGQDTAPAREESARLVRAAQAGEFLESLEALHRVLAALPLPVPVVSGPVVSAPMEAVLGALANTAVARSASGAERQTMKLMRDLKLRTRQCQHVVYDQNLQTGERVLHFAALADRERHFNDSLELVCGEVLAAAETMWVPADRGDWKRAGEFSPQDNGYLQCPGCAAHADTFEESSEGQLYPALSARQLKTVLRGAAFELRCNLPGTLKVYGPSPPVFREMALAAYRTGLSSLVAHEFSVAGEWPFRDGLLAKSQYEMLLDYASQHKPPRAELAGILNEETWRELLSAVVFDTLPPADLASNPPASTVASRVVDAVRDRLDGRHYIAL